MRGFWGSEGRRLAPGAIVVAPGSVPEWTKGADCKSAGVRLRRFKSVPAHQPTKPTKPTNPQVAAQQDEAFDSANLSHPQASNAEDEGSHANGSHEHDPLQARDCVARRGMAGQMGQQ